MAKQTLTYPRLTGGARLIDSHCHLDQKPYRDDLEAVLQRATEHGVYHTITIGIDVATSQKAIDLATRYSCLSATVGVHPHDVDEVGPEAYDILAQMADSHRDLVVGYGEIGLDYFKEYSTAANQRRHFASQLTLARDLRLPIIVHDRDAHNDTLAIIKASGAAVYGGVMHCFSGDLKFAREVLELGLYISLPGVVTFKNAIELQEVARNIPLESLLVETDGPYLAPQPLRGKRNEPVNVLFTAACIAELRGIPLDEVARQTTINARKLFSLPAPADKGEQS